MESKEVKPRQRLLYDILRSSSLYHSEGLYGGLTIKDDNYESVATLELATQLNMDLQGAKKVFKLVGLIHNEDACRVLKDNARLSVFADYHFTKSYTSISNSGGTLCTDFLEAFINGEDPSYHEMKLRKRCIRRKLDALSLRFTKEARDLCVTMFLKVVAVVATLCSFMPLDGSFYPITVIDIIQRYLSSAWECDTRQKLYQKSIMPVHLVDGWILVGEVFKVSVQELTFWKDRMAVGTDSDMRNENTVNEEDLKNNAHRFCQNVVLEFSAWFYQYLSCTDSVNSFLDYFFDVLNSVNEKICKGLGCTKLEPLQRKKVETLLQQISEDSPTMADVKYDTATMRPSKRETRLNRRKKHTVWNPREVLMRCRWENSDVESRYASFLKTAKTEHVPGPRQRLPSSANERRNLPDDTATVIPETPPRTPDQEAIPSTVNTMARNAVPARTVTPTAVTTAAQSQTLLLGKRRHSGMVSLPTGDEDAVLNARAQQSKRLKVCLEQNMKRVQRGQEKQQSKAQNDRYSMFNFVDDADISDDEGPLTSIDAQNLIAAKLVDDTTPPRLVPAPGFQTILEHSNLRIHLFYEVVLGWPIMPIRLSGTLNANKELSKTDEVALSNLINGDTKWANFFWKSRSQSFFRDITTVSTLEEYAEHWRHILHVEVRGTVSDEIASLLPSVKEDIDKNWTVDIPRERFIHERVSEVSPCKGIFNIVCRSTSPELNKRIVKDLQGSTICVGYIEHAKKGTSSSLVLILCRKVHWNDEDEYPSGADVMIDEIKLNMVISRDRARYSGGIWKDEDVLHFFPLVPFASYLRMFRSVQEVSLLPRNIARILCGPRNRIEFPEPVMDSLPARGIDVGCEDYIKGVKETTQLLDHSQFRAVRTVLKNIGACERGSNSLTLIQGPPGTGKTTLINVLMGALLSHSKAGHLGWQQISELKGKIPADDIVSCSKNDFGLRILICCPSNQTVDNILRRMHEDGIPDGKGGSFRPQAVRLAREGYNYGDLQAYSLNSKALPFDLFKHHKDEPNRKNASSAARKSFAKECLVVFCTLCTAGGSRLKNMKMRFDAVIVDEAGQCLEPECLFPATTIMRNTIFGRCHLALVGDPRQLPAVSKGSQVVIKSEIRRHIDYNEQTKSLLERLMSKQRASFEMLRWQYRMHPCISELHSPIFYNGKVKSSLPSKIFETRYNKGWNRISRCFAPVTLIDTSAIPDRFEHNDGNGSVLNLTEVNIIDEILYDLKRLSGDEFEALRNEICVIVPYRSQAAHLREVLERYGKYREGERVSTQGFQIKVDTVDSMQGSQRDVVIFGATRSNFRQKVGFVDCANRLNVAVSRARKLLIAIADMSTFELTKKFEDIRKYCVTGSNGAVMLERKMRPNETCGTGEAVLVFDSNYGKQL